MLKASIGGKDAARPRAGNMNRIYRHPVVEVLRPLLAPLFGTDTPGGKKQPRKWFAFQLALAAILISWETAASLTQRFEAILPVLDASTPRRKRTGRTYRGFIKALVKRSRFLLDLLMPHLRLLVEAAAGASWMIGGFVPIGVDGSKFEAPRTTSNEALGFAGKDKCGPQMMAVMMVHLGTMLPWAFRAGPVKRAERTLLRLMMNLLPEKAILIADAGFTGFDLLCELRGRGCSFLIRVGKNVHLLRELGYAKREGKQTVYLWPDRLQKRPPLVLRLIQVGEMYLITDVRDPKRLSKATAMELYRRRWGVEVAWRNLKQTLDRTKVRCHTARNAVAELHWAAVALWVLCLVGTRGLAAAGVHPRRMSVAKALAAVRAEMRQPVYHGRAGHGTRSSRRPPTRRLMIRLRAAVIDSAKRRSSKDAYRWPRKKKTTAPGTPQIVMASASQVAKAKGLASLDQAV